MKLADIRTIQDLLGVAFKIDYDRPIQVYYPEFDEYRTFQEPFIPALERSYYVKNGVMIFRTYFACYIIPYSAQLEVILKNNGYWRSSMFVPFSNGEIPADQAEHWYSLLRLVKNNQ
ncbi:MAG: hypothetical protein IKG56_03875 [Clostridia bacterium]|nr:hypothetical protein [Clostridia bacterium]